MKLNPFFKLIILLFSLSGSLVAQESIFYELALNPDASISRWFLNNELTDVSGNKYSYSRVALSDQNRKHLLFVPPDSVYNTYLDPVAYGQDVQCIIKFSYDNATNYIFADLYKYDKETGTVGELVTTLNSNIHSGFIKNRLTEIFWNHAIQGDFIANKHFYINRNYGFIRLPNENPVSVQGEMDISSGETTAVTSIVNTNNGKCIYVDKMLQPTFVSVYKMLESRPEFQAFFDLMKGFPEDFANRVFVKQGVDFRIGFLGAFHYTIYVPTNVAIQNALQLGVVKTWEQINAITDTQLRETEMNALIKFLRYHIQDHALFYGDQVDAKFRTATLKEGDNISHHNTGKNKFYQLQASGATESMKIITEQGKEVNVIAPNNLVAREYVFNKLPEQFRNIDGTGSVTGSQFNTSLITFSTSIVLHQIDDILQFE